MSALLHSIKLVLAPPHPAGKPFIAIGAAVAVAGFLASFWAPFWWVQAIGWLGLAFTLFCLYFFRDPERVTPPAPDLVVAPADGKVVLVGPAVPPPELGLGDAPRQRVAIFLSVLDVHVNRMPCAAIVERAAYHKGQFLNASLDKASVLNERNALALRLPDGRDMAVVQIAGLIARRILSTARPGAAFAAGQRFGIIRFGSRTDLYLPPGVMPQVLIGQTMIGGETVIARL